MSDEHSNDVAIRGYPPIPSEIPTTKDGWRQRAIGLKLRLSAAESQNQALQERIDRLRVTRDALDEAATRPASPGEWEDVHNEFMDAVNNALSPTQETDPPEDEDEKVVRLAMSGDENAKRQLVRAWRSVHGDPTLRPDYAYRPTQETDPG
jgi:hypothetical protein